MLAGTGGASVAKRVAAQGVADAGLPLMRLGVHSVRLDVGARDVPPVEALGLNCAWYADILLTLTEY